MANVSSYKFAEGLESIEEVASERGLALKTLVRVPAKKFAIRAFSVFDDDGLMEFRAELMSQRGALIFNGTKQNGDFRVDFRSICQHGTIVFEAGGYDLTTFDLMVLEEEDLKLVEDGDTVRMLDPIALEIHQGKVGVKGVKTESGRGGVELGFDFHGEQHRYVFDKARGEIVSWSVGDRGFEEIGAGDVEKYLTSIGA